MLLDSRKPNKLLYMIRIPIKKLKDHIIKVVLPFDYVTPIITIEINRPDKLTSITIYPANHISIEEGSILLQVLNYLFYKVTNSLEIPNEIIVNGQVLPEKVKQRKAKKDKLLIALYYQLPEEGRASWYETLLVRDEVWIKLFFNYEDNTNYKNLLDIGLKFNRRLFKSESFDLAYFVTFVIYRICTGDYSFYDTNIYSSAKHPFNEEKIEAFVIGCKKCDVANVDLRRDLDITELSEIGNCSNDWRNVY